MEDPTKYMGRPISEAVEDVVDKLSNMSAKERKGRMERILKMLEYRPRVQQAFEEAFQKSFGTAEGAR